MDNRDHGVRRGVEERVGAGEEEVVQKEERDNDVGVELIHRQAERASPAEETEPQQEKEVQDGEFSSRHHVLARSEGSRHTPGVVGEALSTSWRGGDGRDGVGRSSVKRPRWYPRPSESSSHQDPQGQGGEEGRLACGKPGSFHRDNSLAVYGV